MMEKEIQILFIRHGKTPGNKEGRYIGRYTDEALADTGIETLLENKNEIMRITRHYSQFNFFSSPMKRCLETAEVLFGNVKPVVIPEFAEMDFGIIEGKNYAELEDDDRYRKWVELRGLTDVHEGEHREAFAERCMAGLQQLVSCILTGECTNVSENIKSDEGIKGTEDTLNIAVVHGGTIMAILSHLFGEDYYNFQVKNGAGYLVTLRITGENVNGISYCSIHNWISP